MPRLWSETVASHRGEVRDAILEATATLIDRHGALSLTMSHIAEATGIGRATLYKYFSDVEAILHAWHARQVSEHVERLQRASEHGTSSLERLLSALNEFAAICHEARGRPHGELAHVLHRNDHVSESERQVLELFEDLIARAMADGAVRGDTRPRELAAYCLHALSAARTAPSRAAVDRLLQVTVSGLMPAS